MLGYEIIAFTSSVSVTDVATAIYTKSYSKPIGAIFVWVNNSYEIDTSQKPHVYDSNYNTYIISYTGSSSNYKVYTYFTFNGNTLTVTQRMNTSGTQSENLTVFGWVIPA